MEGQEITSYPWWRTASSHTFRTGTLLFPQPFRQTRCSTIPTVGERDGAPSDPQDRRTTKPIWGSGVEWKGVNRIYTPGGIQDVKPNVDTIDVGLDRVLNGTVQILVQKSEVLPPVQFTPGPPVGVRRAGAPVPGWLGGSWGAKRPAGAPLCVAPKGTIGSLGVAPLVWVCL